MQNDQQNSVNPEPKLTHGDKIIQPVSDLSNFTKAEPTAPEPSPAPTQPESPAKAPTFDPSNIYPTATEAGVDSNSLPNNSSKDSLNISNELVSSRVKGVLVYAIILICFSLLYVLFWLSLFFWGLSSINSAENSSTVGLSLLLNPILLISLLLPAAGIGLGIYLLRARNIQTVSTVLTVMLVLNGMQLLSGIGRITNSALWHNPLLIIQYFIPIVLFAYLWHIRQQVSAEISTGR